LLEAHEHEIVRSEPGSANDDRVAGIEVRGRTIPGIERRARRSGSERARSDRRDDDECTDDETHNLHRPIVPVISRFFKGFVRSSLETPDDHDEHDPDDEQNAADDAHEHDVAFAPRRGPGRQRRQREHGRGKKKGRGRSPALLTT
jgi:hypothetical protein